MRPLCGRPLFHHIIQTLLDSAAVSAVAIDTDSVPIMEETAEWFPSVRVLARPTHLCGEMLNANDILLNAVPQLEGDLFLQTHSTNPLLRSQTIDSAVSAFLASREEFDSMFTVTNVYKRLYTADGVAMNHSPDVLLRTQDLAPVLEENSCMYVFDRATLERRQSRLGDHPLLFAIPAEEALDIDTELDFQIVEAVVDASRGR